ncbi:PTS glucose transporter subunit IIA [Gleimia sp. 6138-11-ORH1]|uniref:PTS sugar transporter subunit IIA n=1 Tax=Gleimia sp. 6138-11-ORH1 TaxID=2973937 RepID=UPI002167524C|nr:PTS glucose transporter subunit IIA [Gleimia sp. 6138-11-ORH1]MCS4484803.1 PTS glucose transporter subunit IIA [Gleimia sp. 6138-11-ORH1]
MTQLASPLNGVMRSLADVPDPVFAEGIVGPGFAIEPEIGESVEAVSPISGTLAKVLPHAFIVVKDDLTVLVHLGIDTVKLNGAGFSVVASENDEVKAGQVIVKWDTKGTKAKGVSTICPIVVLDTTSPVTTLMEIGTAVKQAQLVASFME